MPTLRRQTQLENPQQHLPLNPAKIRRALNLAEEKPQQAVDALIAMPENQWYERKSGRIAPAALAKPLVAMANAEGGVVLVGIENGKIVPVSDTNSLRQVLEWSIISDLGCTKDVGQSLIRENQRYGFNIEA